MCFLLFSVVFRCVVCLYGVSASLVLLFRRVLICELCVFFVVFLWFLFGFVVSVSVFMIHCFPSVLRSFRMLLLLQLVAAFFLLAHLGCCCCWCTLPSTKRHSSHTAHRDVLCLHRDLDSNQLTGRIPDSLGNQSSLEYMYLPFC